MAETREIHDVLEDVHGVLVERKVEGAEEHPERIVLAAQDHAVLCCQDSFEQVLGAGLRPEVDAHELWIAEQRAMELTPYEDKGKPLRPVQFFVRVNLKTLQIQFPDLMKRFKPIDQMRVARRMRKLRRQDRLPYTMYDDMRAFMHRVYQEHGAVQHLATGKELPRLHTLIKRRQIPVRACHVDKMFSATELAANKLSTQYWGKILYTLGRQAHEVVMIGNEVTIDGACTRAGIAALILDRGGLKQKYFRERGVTRYGVPYLSLEDDLPPRRAFIGFAQNPNELWSWLERMPAPPAEG